MLLGSLRPLREVLEMTGRSEHRVAALNKHLAGAKVREESAGNIITHDKCVCGCLEASMVSTGRCGLHNFSKEAPIHVKVSA